MKVDLYNQLADKVGKVDLPDDVFALPMNTDLLHQVVTSQFSNRRQNIAHAKDRSEVRGGGKKPWRQKGTGNARHGSRRSPIWKGGGVTFGPRNERNYKKKINRKMAKRALLVALSSKVKDQELAVIDEIKLENLKTKEMAQVIKNMAKLFTSKGGSILIMVPEKSGKDMVRVTKNLQKVSVIEVKNINALDVISRKNLVILKDALNVMDAMLLNK